MQIKGLRQKARGALPKRKVRPRSPVAPPRSVRKQKLLPSRPKHIPDLTQRPAHILWQHHHAKAAAKTIQLSREAYMQDERLCI